MKKEAIRKLILAWQNSVLPDLRNLLAAFFDAVDAVLIEYADKSESNQVQATFFEGQREISRKRDVVRDRFTENLTRDLLLFLRPPRRADAPGAEVLSLVSEDAFERSLALRTICEQAIKHNQDLYYALSQRLGVISGGPATPYEDLPAGPHQLARLFEDAADLLNIERRVRLALYTLFEREVIRESPRWHDNLNESLKKAGVLPHLKYDLKLDPGQQRPGTSSTEDLEPTAQASGGSHSRPGSAPMYSAARTARASYSPAPTASTTAPGLSSARSTDANDRTSAKYSLPRYTGSAADPNLAGGGSPYEAPTVMGGGPHDEGARVPLRSTGLGDPLYAGAGEGGRGVGDELLARIRELLIAQRSRRARSGAASARPEPTFPASSTTVAAAIESRQVQEAHALPHTGVFRDGVQRVVVPRELLEKLRVALATQRSKIKEAVGEDKLSHFDEDTIDIVGMLFEVMLKDDRLNNTVKALLSHLHTPYLKLAVRDKVFLRNREHPARLLLDNMVEAGTHWVDERDLTSGIYSRLQRIVDLIMKAGDNPFTLIEELNDGLAADIQLRAKRQQVREVRTVEAEKGEARLDQARAVAATTARRFLRAGGSPAPFQDFILGPWTDYMTLLYLRSNGNTDTAIWHGALALCNRLSGYVEAARGGRLPSDTEIQSLRADLVQRLGEAIPNFEAKVERLFEVFAVDREIAIVSPRPEEPVHETKPVQLSSKASELLERLPKLPPGSWVVFHDPDGDRAVKLSWFNPRTERFLFVDQVGAKALVVPLGQLANKIDREKAHVMLATGASYVESSLERALNALQKRDTN